ncbi:MAG TPA: PHP domain-containing protein [Candidatus Limnocylindrales bacterium]|nr:PHP domain-containing protein [Candidatus Limnocylindrales bacterium]
MAGADRHAAEPSDPVLPPRPSPIDLHTHTRRSDGVVEPVDLVAQAHAAGVRVLAITDHDTLAAFRELRASSAVPPDLQLTPAVEINAVADGRDGFWEGELHVLGFGMDPDDEAFEAALAGQRAQRRRRFERILTRLRGLGMAVDDVVDAAANDDAALGRPTVARALIAKGHATSVEDAFRRWLGHGMPAWAPRDGLGPRQAIEAIAAAGGVPVLAHFGEARDRIAVIRELVGLGLRGLEVHYRSWDRETVERVHGVADELGLIRTGGTDYHGDLGPYAEAHAGLWVPPEVAERLLSAMRR